ncbi:hypothetical protein LINGRAHAP2_LOCUS14147 [Linum grandiflorum]
MYIRSPKTSRSQKSQMLRREDHCNGTTKGKRRGMSTKQQSVLEANPPKREPNPLRRGIHLLE